MQIISVIIIIFFSSFPFLQIQADTDSFKAFVPFTNYKPVIDGIIEDEWQNAWTMNLLVNKGENKGQNPRNPTIAKVMWDYENLYIAFICYDDNICRKIYKRDADLWSINPDTEVCEMLLCFDDTEKNYYEFNLHPSGALLDSIVSWKNKTISFDKTWNSKTSCQVYINKYNEKDIFWSVEFAISWSSFHFEPKTGAHFKGNFYRVNNSQEPERLAWIPTNAWFHVPEKFGVLCLTQ